MVELLELLESWLAKPYVPAVCLAVALVFARSWELARRRDPRTPGSPSTLAAWALLVGWTVALGWSLVELFTVILPNGYLGLGFHRLAGERLLTVLNTTSLYALGLAVVLTLYGWTLVRPQRGDDPRRDTILRTLPLTLLLGSVPGAFLLRALDPANRPWSAALGLVGCWILAFFLSVEATRLLRRFGGSRSTRPLHPVLLFVSAVGLLLVGANVFARFVRPAPSTLHPNLVLVSLDTLRADHLGCYGYGRETSPHLDRLAAEGTRFEHALAQSSWTLPSHMSMLTGLYPPHHGVALQDQSLPLSRTTLAEVLGDAGYSTAAFTGGGYLQREFGYQGFDVFSSLDHANGRRNAGRVLDRATAWLDDELPEPFFLFFHTYQAHAPYEPPATHDQFDDPTYGGPVRVEGRTGPYFRSVHETLDAEDYRHVIAKYDGEVLYTDSVIGRLLALLETRGLGERTVVVVTSDHGENFDDHPAYPIGHQQLYDPVLRVPLLVRGPGIPRGVTVSEQVELVDLMPTVLDLLGVDPPLELDGRSLERVLTGPGNEPLEDRPAYAEYHSPRGDVSRSVRTPGWKLLMRGRRSDHGVEMDHEAIELYDLRSDPGERNDLSGRRPTPEDRLRRLMGLWVRRHSADELPRIEAPAGAALDPELTLKLEALGYL